ncbi:MAG: PVC-type heme-binding CxxCH protein [Planctomycetota bacterium]
MAIPVLFGLSGGILMWLMLVAAVMQFGDADANGDALPKVPAGFEVTEWAREPLVRQPCSLAFDGRGRMFVGMGPQYRNPLPETPGDSVMLLEDTDGDGRCDRAHEFARGFNTIQGLAWRGRDLWIANAPDLTICRDLSGDDVADEYVRLYTDLGNLEHGLHGLTWAADGRLYMSKGNSKGLTEPGRIAPRAFRELWGVTAPEGTPDLPPPVVFSRDKYERSYHDPEDDWGREGGVLRCEADGSGLEVISGGFRNPWDIAVDSSLEWLGTDNDQNQGDRVFSPFRGAHFGWNHPWSSHWSLEPHLPTAPVSGPMFEGSGTGVVYCDLPTFPAEYRRVFFVNDWLRKATFVWRPAWQGAQMVPRSGDWELFADGAGALYRPTDLEPGPDGALYVLGWSRGYGAEWRDGKFVSEGRIFRICGSGEGAGQHREDLAAITAGTSVQDLMAAFSGILPARRTEAQLELLRRGEAVLETLCRSIERGGLDEQQETWTIWTLARLFPAGLSGDGWFEQQLQSAGASANLRRQCVRILADRQVRSGSSSGLPGGVRDLLSSGDARERLAAVLAVQQLAETASASALLELLGTESDAVVFYAGWQTMRRIMSRSELERALEDARAGVRRAAFLALAESGWMQPAVAERLAQTEATASLWLEKNAGGGEAVVLRGRPLSAGGSLFADAGPAAGSAATSSHDLSVVRDVRAKSGRKYDVQAGGLRSGAVIFSDRAYRFRSVPEELVGADLIRTANDDDGAQGEDCLQFELRIPTTVIVGLDERTAVVPEWLQRDYEALGRLLEADHWRMRLYRRSFGAGPVVLGGNTQDGRSGGKSNYTVILLPQLSGSGMEDEPATVAGAEELLGGASVERGRMLFGHPLGAGCGRCHSLDGRVNGFGPALGDIGRRSGARQILQSIVEPSAVITEGFAQHVVQTVDGRVHAGVLLEESGLAVTVGLATGDRLVVRKSEIEERRSERISAMPDFRSRLGNGDVADLAAFLLTQTSVPRASASGGPQNSVRSPGAGGEGITELPDRLKLSDRWGEIGEFVFSDPRIRRPFFANLKTVRGFHVTRNHPPVEGRDALDHDTMHPGLWLGFGALGGSDFWRNKGVMEHVGFVVRPEVRDGVIRFGTECLLKDESGRVLGRMQHRLRLDVWEGQRRIQWEAEFFADSGDLAFGDQEEMGFGARVATELTEKSGGRISNSDGLETAAGTWGRAADWCDYSGEVTGERLGILLLASPRNFRRSWWHNRDYGVFVANAFGRAAMGQGPRSEWVVKTGERLRLSYAAVLHDSRDFDPAAAWAALQREESDSGKK